MLYLFGGEADLEAGMIVLSDTGACPSGYTRVSTLDDRFPRGASTAGGTGGAASHVHNVQGHTHTGGSHSHTMPSHTHTWSVTSGLASPQSHATGGSSVYNISPQSHKHSASGTTGSATPTTGATAPSWSTAAAADTDSASNDPPYLDWILCKKD